MSRRVDGGRVLVHVDGVLFDSDGVLVDSHHHVDAAWRRMADELDLPSLAVEHVGIRAADVLARHLTGDALRAAIDRVTEIELADAADVAAVRGASELCRSLPADGWVVVTSASRDLARARWAGAGLDITGPTVTADDVTSGKPDPEPYLRGAALIGAAPERCVVFEDSASGARAARAAGADVIAVGDDAWDVEPLARVPDLRSVRVQRSPSHRFALRLDGIDPA